MEIKGKIIAALPPKSGVAKSGKEWQSQEYVLETSDQYPKKMCFNVFGGEKIAEFNICIGEVVTVHFDVDAKQWQDRWFNSINAWKVGKEAQSSANAYQSQPSTYQQPVQQSAPVDQSNQKDDLPF